ncbi:MAG: hypothetical protein WBW61_03315 [Rhodanobacteraceae bacterium]
MNIRTNLLIALALPAAAFFTSTATAATFTVDGLFDDADAHDAAPGDGICADNFGTCTLRAAIEESNALAGADQIWFSVNGTIQVAATQGPLPQVTGQLDIDGTTAPGYAGPSLDLEDAPPTIYIDGSAVGGSGGSANGLRFFGSGASSGGVRAVGVVRFGTGISISNSVSTFLVDSCYIGLLADGSAAGNGQGIFIGSDSNFIGRFASGFFGNVISANVDSGISLGVAANNVIAGNRIGTTPDGIGARGNGIGLVGVAANGNFIGTFNNTLDLGNLISGNTGNAIQILGSDNEIDANTIGINKNGAQLANGGIGIDLTGNNNTVGSTDTNGQNDIANNTDGIVIDGDGNTIAGNILGSITFSQGNNGDGIRIDGGNDNSVIGNRVMNSADDGIDLLGDATTVQNNIVGYADFAVGGIQDFGNDGEGVHVRSDANVIGGDIDAANRIGFSGVDGVDIEGSDNVVDFNFIGVTDDGRSIGNAGDGVGLVSTAGAITANRISFNSIGYNGETGVEIGPGVGNANPVYGNSIFANAGIGIDLSADGVTPNDPGDGDVGPNRLQNYPTIISAVLDTAASPPELTVQWQIDSTSINSDYDIFADFYLADNAANAQGRVYLGFSTASAPNVTYTHTFMLAPGTAGGLLVATATDGDGVASTSEFSPATPFGNPDSIFANGFDP